MSPGGGTDGAPGATGTRSPGVYAGLELLAAGDPDEEVLGAALRLLRRGRAEEALELLDGLPGTGAPQDVPGYAPGVLRAVCLLAAGRPEQALDRLRALLDVFGPDPDLMRLTGLACTGTGDYPAAERAYLVGLHDDPHDIALLCAYAELCARAAQPEKADALWAWAAVLDPDNPELHRIRAGIDYVLGARRPPPGGGTQRPAVTGRGDR
ncbi:tetratricopeptide repeat protein [Streptomyces sp. NPDC059637]|uniref:tetratricopeptide repeat protein n=1 Tax=Streptomyces sp. NPDC059637 TaxID=3347752 RepID=UPI003679FCF7